MERPDHITDIFASLTTLTARACEMNIHYEFGPWDEVRDTLRRMRSGKYPIIMLAMPYTEDRGNRADIEANLSLELIVATFTQPTIKTGERIESTFKPVLNPIYNSLIEQIRTCGWFNFADRELVKHSKTDQVNWGRAGLFENTDIKFNDFIDAIHIQNLKLELKHKICYGNNSQ